MEYIGERLLPGQLGHFCIILSLVSSLIASIAYFKSTQSISLEDKQSWKRIARIAFGLDVIAVFAVF